MQKHVHILVTGRVQLVMYRDFTQRNAKKAGIVGTVRNLHNGAVEIYAQGDEKDLDRFIERLRKGSPLSRVHSVTIDELSELQAYEGFTIVY